MQNTNRKKKNINRNVEIVLNYFGKNKFNEINIDFFEPTYSSIRQIYPYNKIHIFSDISVQNNRNDKNLKITKIKTKLNSNHARYGWRCSDYYRFWSLTQIKNKIVIYLDNDFKIISDEFKLIENFAKDYGMTIASNPRLTDRVDRKVGSDVIIRKYKKTDTAKGLGYTFNNGLFAVDTKNRYAMRAIRFTMKEYVKCFERGPTVIYNSFRIKKFNPYLLPPQWNINNLEVLNGKHLFDDALVLHLNHPNVFKTYKKKIFYNKILKNKFFIKILSFFRKLKK